MCLNIYIRQNVVLLFNFNKCCSFEFSFHQRIRGKMYHSFHKSTTVFNISDINDNNNNNNNNKFLEQQELFLKDHVTLIPVK